MSKANDHRYEVVWYGCTSVGKKRKNNEDALVALTLSQPFIDLKTSDAAQAVTEGSASLNNDAALLAVADGMGGAKAGEIASHMAVRILARGVHEVAQRAAVDESRDAIPLMDKVVKDANDAIREDGKSNPARRGMGTTLTAAWLHKNWVQLAQIGDSRAYCFRGGQLKPLTKDQSLVAKLLEDEIITPEEAENMTGRNIILQALGSEDSLDVVPSTHKIRDRDLLLLCTDGLTTVLRDDDLLAILREGDQLETLCKTLIAKAEQGGGPDNITVILGRIQKQD